MNREMKFRLWDDGKKIWTNPGLLRVDSNGGLYTQRDGGPYIESMSTGLHDKNGKEIYGEDIVINNHWIDKFMTGSFVIEYSSESGAFVLRNKKNLGDFISQAFWRDKHEIIGNKFENPELLEGLK